MKWGNAARSLTGRFRAATISVAIAIVFEGASFGQADPPQQPPAQPADAPPAAAPKDTNTNPCRADAARVKGWLDRVQLALSSTVCGSAMWFDGFFGDTSNNDPNQFYGDLGLGFLWKEKIGWDPRSRFDVNLPLRNLQRRAKLFLGRADEDSYISNENYGPGDEIGAIGSQTGQDWLIGLGYSPVHGANSHLDYKLGARASTNPYLFGQARYRYLHNVSANRKWHAEETVFYRTDNDGWGTTTSFTYDWRLFPALMLRSSATGTLSQDTNGVKWKYQAILYENLGGAQGHERAIAYKGVVRGETGEIASLAEYGLIATYRQQVFRPWLFAESTLGYTWDDTAETDWERKGSVNVGLLLDIRFGDPTANTP